MKRPILALLLVVVALWMNAFLSINSGSTDYFRALTEVQNIQTAAELFQREYGEYPKEGSWQDEILGTDAAVVNVKRVVFHAKEEDAFVDPWGNAYRYVLMDEGSGPVPFVYSMGLDEQSVSSGFDQDDISSLQKGTNPYYTSALPLGLAQVFLGPVTALLVLLAGWLAMNKLRARVEETDGDESL